MEDRLMAGAQQQLHPTKEVYCLREALRKKYTSLKKCRGNAADRTRPLATWKHPLHVIDGGPASGKRSNACDRKNRYRKYVLFVSGKKKSTTDGGARYVYMRMRRLE